MTISKLFEPIEIGPSKLQHRIAMAPLTRLRATHDRIPVPLMKEYYIQRASTPGTLIITEGTCVSRTAAGGFANAPGIWNTEQIEAWKDITRAVHEKGCSIVCQLFAMGRTANAEVAREEGVDIVGPSAIPIDDSSPVPKAMTLEEIQTSIEEFVQAARNAMEAGFDGVEVHGANGYLIDQFIQDTANQRDDIYGGSIPNRSRFVLDILRKTVVTIGADRIGLRLSPWSTFQGMRMADPIPQFEDIIVAADEMQLAYLHLVESRISGAEDAIGTDKLDFAYKLWSGPLLIAGGYTFAEARTLVDEQYPDKDIVVVFGRAFLSNPDLVYRFRMGLELNKHDRGTFYTHSSIGYTDYPFSAQYRASQQMDLLSQQAALESD